MKTKAANTRRGAYDAVRTTHTMRTGAYDAVKLNSGTWLIPGIWFVPNADSSTDYSLTK